MDKGEEGCPGPTRGKIRGYAKDTSMGFIELIQQKWSNQVICVIRCYTYQQSLNMSHTNARCENVGGNNNKTTTMSTNSKQHKFKTMTNSLQTFGSTDNTYSNKRNKYVQH